MATHSLAEKLAALTNPGPEFGHLEEEEEDLVTGAKVADGDLEDGEDNEERSHLRTMTAGGLEGDERYKGKRFSRKELEKDRDFMEHSGAELGHMFDFEGGEEGSSESEVEEGDSEEEDSDEGEGDEEMEDEEDMDSEDDDIAIEDTSANDDTIVKVGETDSSYSKGVAVVSQTNCWDKLLEQRILLQKMLSKVNTFPQDLEQFMEPEDREHKELVRQASKSLSKLVQKSVQLKNCMERKGVEESAVVGSDMEEMGQWLEETGKVMENGRREKIVRWSDKTQRVGTMGSMNTPTLEQIDQIMSNTDRLVKRTRVKRVDCTILGSRGNKEEEVNMFDDSDFYHHLLRELIEKKTAASSDSAEVGRQWLQIQKLRSKLKKKVDTRASKGRKVRYDIHTKLVNFMAPVSQPEQMTESAKNELFSSLFGARKITSA